MKNGENKIKAIIIILVSSLIIVILAIALLTTANNEEKLDYHDYPQDLPTYAHDVK